MFTNYRYNWKKRNKKYLRKLTDFPVPKNCRTKKNLDHISVSLPKFIIEKLKPKELKTTQLLCKKLYKQGYQTDLRTLSLFVISKKNVPINVLKTLFFTPKIFKIKCPMTVSLITFRRDIFWE